MYVVSVGVLRLYLFLFYFISGFEPYLLKCVFEVLLVNMVKLFLDFSINFKQQVTLYV